MSNLREPYEKKSFLIRKTFLTFSLIVSFTMMSTRVEACLVATNKVLFCFVFCFCMCVSLFDPL